MQGVLSVWKSARKQVVPCHHFFRDLFFPPPLLTRPFCCLLRGFDWDVLQVAAGCSVQEAVQEAVCPSGLSVAHWESALCRL